MEEMRASVADSKEKAASRGQAVSPAPSGVSWPSAPPLSKGVSAASFAALARVAGNSAMCSAVARSSAVVLQRQGPHGSRGAAAGRGRILLRGQQRDPSDELAAVADAAGVISQFEGALSGRVHGDGLEFGGRVYPLVSTPAQPDSTLSVRVGPGGLLLEPAPMPASGSLHGPSSRYRAYLAHRDGSTRDTGIVVTAGGLGPVGRILAYSTHLQVGVATEVRGRPPRNTAQLGARIAGYLRQAGITAPGVTAFTVQAMIRESGVNAAEFREVLSVLSQRGQIQRFFHLLHNQGLRQTAWGLGLNPEEVFAQYQWDATDAIALFSGFLAGAIEGAIGDPDQVMRLVVTLVGWPIDASLRRDGMAQMQAIAALLRHPLMSATSALRSLREEIRRALHECDYFAAGSAVGTAVGTIAGLAEGGYGAFTGLRATVQVARAARVAVQDLVHLGVPAADLAAAVVLEGQSTVIHGRRFVRSGRDLLVIGADGRPLGRVAQDLVREQAATVTDLGEGALRAGERTAIPPPEPTSPIRSAAEGGRGPAAPASTPDGSPGGFIRPQDRPTRPVSPQPRREPRPPSRGEVEAHEGLRTTQPYVPQPSGRVHSLAGLGEAAAVAEFRRRVTLAGSREVALLRTPDGRFAILQGTRNMTDYLHEAAELLEVRRVEVIEHSHGDLRRLARERGRTLTPQDWELSTYPSGSNGDLGVWERELRADPSIRRIERRIRTDTPYGWATTTVTLELDAGERVRVGVLRPDPFQRGHMIPSQYASIEDFDRIRAGLGGDQPARGSSRGSAPTSPPTSPPGAGGPVRSPGPPGPNRAGRRQGRARPGLEQVSEEAALAEATIRLRAEALVEAAPSFSPGTAETFAELPSGAGGRARFATVSAAVAAAEQRANRFLEIFRSRVRSQVGEVTGDWSDVAPRLRPALEQAYREAGQLNSGDSRLFMGELPQLSRAQRSRLATTISESSRTIVVDVLNDLQNAELSDVRVISSAPQWGVTPARTLTAPSHGGQRWRSRMP